MSSRVQCSIYTLTQTQVALMSSHTEEEKDPLAVLIALHRAPSGRGRWGARCWLLAPSPAPWLWLDHRAARSSWSQLAWAAAGGVESRKARGWHHAGGGGGGGGGALVGVRAYPQAAGGRRCYYDVPTHHTGGGGGVESSCRHSVAPAAGARPSGTVLVVLLI
jgi:hypothetical protein